MKTPTLWKDTFKIEITVVKNPYSKEKEDYTVEFTGSLKGAIRHVQNLTYKGNITAVFYTSSGAYIKEIGI